MALMKRHVFAADSLPVAESIVRVARESGVDKDCVHLEARSDLETACLDDDEKYVSMDIIPAAWHGTLGGAAAGLVAGLIGMAVPFFGISLAGALALSVLGALVGTWAGVLMGAALPDQVRRTFKDEIEAGKILVVIDTEPEDFAAIEAAITRAGGLRLPYEASSSLA